MLASTRDEERNELLQQVVVFGDVLHRRKVIGLEGWGTSVLYLSGPRKLLIHFQSFATMPRPTKAGRLVYYT